MGIKSFIAGAAFGLVFGQVWFFFSPINGFAAQKLFAAVGERPFSGRMLRMFKEVSIPHMLYGGTSFFFYTFTFDVLRHHAETNLRPKIVDHTLALGILGASLGALTG